ncbi:MAG: type II toxin-antitoxin system RelE/ParE family toxin [Pseudomonadota bacterium]
METDDPRLRDELFGYLLSGFECTDEHDAYLRREIELTKAPSKSGVPDARPWRDIIVCVLKDISAFEEDDLEGHVLAESDLLNYLDMVDLQESEDLAEAGSVLAAIFYVTQMVSKYPFAGRLGRIEGTREILVPSTPFLVVYSEPGERVRIDRILHGNIQLPHEAAHD